MKTSWGTDASVIAVPTRRGRRPPERRAPRLALGILWAGFVVAAIILLDFVDLTLYGLVVPGVAIALAVVSTRARTLRMPGLRWVRLGPDRGDLLAIGVLFAAVVALFKLAFGVFTDSTLGLFLSFGAGLVLGVVGPIVYTVWARGRPLSSLGLGLHRWRSTVALAVLLGTVQFSITLWGYDMPPPVDWVPLLVMSLVVGLFEAVFFRGFVQGALERSFGTGSAVLGAAALYAVYHVGYGMGGSEMVFLFGLGVVYAVAYRITENVLVLWPLLTPLGAFFNNLEAGDLAGQLPWASIAGFADVLGLMVAAIWLGHRREKRPGARRGMGAAALQRGS